MESESLATPPPARAQTCARCGFDFAARLCPRCAFSELLDASGSSTAGSSFPSLPGVKWTPPLSFQQYRLDVDADGAPVELGRGGMGVTFKAFDTQLEIPVVLKFINPLLFGGPAVEQRFLREARVAARLRHHHIATVLNLGQHDGCWFYAMEFVPGRTLAQLVDDDGPLNSEETREVGRQTALALAEAGRLQLVHRDIKPSNLMVERRAEGLRVKIIDFGLVKTLDALDDPRLTDSGMLGTPHFASPEQLREGPVDQRADFYALGGTLWFALTGRTLARGSRAEVMAHHLKPPGGHILAEEGRAKSLPKGWNEILRTLLSFDPIARPADAVGVLILLEMRAPLPSPARRPWLQQKAVMLAGCSVAVALGVSWAFAPTPTKPDPARAAELVERARRAMAKLTPAENEMAIGLLQQAIAKDPSSSNAYAILARSYVQNQLRFNQGRQWLARADEMVQRARQLEPQNAEAQRAFAHVRYAQGRYREAQAILEEAAATHPDDARILLGQATYARELGELKQALRLIRVATARPDATATFWSIRGNIEKKLELDEESRASYTRAIDEARGTPENYLGLAHLLYLCGETKAALAQMRLAESISKDDAGILSLRGQMHIQLEEWTAAEECLRGAVRLNPEGNPIYFGQVRYESLLGWLLLRQGGSTANEGRQRIERAIAMDREELAAGNEGHDYRYSLAASLAALGRADEAIETLRDAIRRGWSDRRVLALDRRFDAMRERLRPLVADLPSLRATAD